MELEKDTNFKTLKISNADKGIYMYTYWSENKLKRKKYNFRYVIFWSIKAQSILCSYKWEDRMEADFQDWKKNELMLLPNANAINLVLLFVAMLSLSIK